MAQSKQTVNYDVKLSLNVPDSCKKMEQDSEKNTQKSE